MDSPARPMARSVAGALAALAALVIAVTVVGCGGSTVDVGTDESPTTIATTTTTTTASPSAGRLRVTQEQTDCCFIEGQVSTVVLRGPAGDEVFRNTFLPYAMVVPVLDRRLAPGTYELVSFQQPCDGNCGSLDDATDRCLESVEIIAGEELFLTAAFAPGRGCAVARTDAPPDSAVPDAFALREPAPDCGVKVTTDGLREDPPDVARPCFRDANAAGDVAELQVYEPGSGSEPRLQIYRTLADGTVVIFETDFAEDGRWHHRTCSGLVPDDEQAFRLDGCAAWEELPGTA